MSFDALSPFYAAVVAVGYFKSLACHGRYKINSRIFRSGGKAFGQIVPCMGSQ